MVKHDFTFLLLCRLYIYFSDNYLGNDGHFILHHSKYLLKYIELFKTVLVYDKIFSLIHYIFTIPISVLVVSIFICRLSKLFLLIMSSKTFYGDDDLLEVINETAMI